MRKAEIFTPAQIRTMEVMRERGKTFDDIAYEFGCSDKKIRKAMIKAGKHTPRKRSPQKKERSKKTTTKPKPQSQPVNIREFLAKQRTKEEAEKAEREKGWCKLYCCNDRKSCTDIQHPENCLVWQLYYDPEKKKIGNQMLKDKRKKQ